MARGSFTVLYLVVLTLSLAVVGSCLALLTVFTLKLLKSGYKLRA